MSKKKTLLICIIILVIAAIITAVVFFTEPTAKRGGATKKTAMLVDVIGVEHGDFQPVIVATGTVQASEDIMLSPRVSGEIIDRSKNFIPGGFVQKGEFLLQIDSADYKNALLLRQSDLRLAQADLNMEMGRQDVAQKDYQLIGDSLSRENKALVLRQPQLQSAQANVEAAQAAVEQAELNLQRSTVRAPFDAHIISRNANIGSQVAPGTPLGRLVGMDEYWVVVTVPLAKLPWLEFSENKNLGSEVKIRNRTAWADDFYRKGFLYKKIGALENQTRLARVIVSVPDPLAYESESDTVPLLMIGSFVETAIKGKLIPDVIRLNRDYLRQDETVWVMKDGKLRIREVDIILEDANFAYIKRGLDKDDKVVTTNLSTVVEGAGLRVEGQTAKSDTTQKDTAQ
jgi:RND family efflux transporter MFP subunit